MRLVEQVNCRTVYPGELFQRSLGFEFLNDRQMSAARTLSITNRFRNHNRPLQQQRGPPRVAQARDNCSVRRQRFSEHRLLPAFFQRSYCGFDCSLCFAQSAFGKQRSRPRLVNLRDRADVFQFHEELSRAIEVLVRILVATDREVEIT